MKKIKEIKAESGPSVARDHLHGTFVPKYIRIGKKWFCRTCGVDVTNLPLLSITYKRIK